MFRYALAALVLTVLAVSAAPAAHIDLRPDAAWAETAAVRDLQRVVYAATGTLLPIGRPKSGDTDIIAVGHAAGADVDLSTEALGDQGYVLKTVRAGDRTVLVAAGATPAATAYAVYELAEQFGAGFYLGGDCLPGERREFALPQLDVMRKPVLEVRGVLPWYNFFNGPTAWNAEDYRAFVDQLARSRNNFLGFHSYDFEPFCAYEDADGRLVDCAPLVSTETSTWGTVPMATSEFAAGTDRYFAREYFGADYSMDYEDPEEGVEAARKLLADALHYARARGVRTCVGFEVSRDPTEPQELDNLERRIAAVLRTYPMLDYIWIWEPEAMGIHGVETPVMRSRFGAYYRRWKNHFSGIDDVKRISEGVRMGIYARVAHRILMREAPHVRLIVSGWGGDNHLHFTDFYPGLDAILPEDVIFAALDNIVVSDTVSAAYGRLSKNREFWPIPWFEYDGDQWMPQPNTRVFAGAVRDALSKGARGLLGIHWRTRDVEESHAYVSQFAWNPQLDYEGFYREYAVRSLGDPQAAEMLTALQDCGYRWLGGGGQMECGTFDWSVGAENGVERMRAALGLYRGGESERLRYLKYTADWAENFNAAARLLHANGDVPKLLAKLRLENRQATDEERTRLSEMLAEARDSLAKGLHALARRTSNRGELGVLATVNAKSWASLRDIIKQARELADVDLAGPLPSDSGPFEVSSILRSSMAFAGEPFRISALVHSPPEGAQASVVHRTAGGEWRKTPLSFVNLGRLEGHIPAEDVRGEVMEYYILVEAGEARATWPEGAPESRHYLSVIERPRPAAPRHTPTEQPAEAISALRHVVGPLLVQLEWECGPEVRVFQIQRRTQEDATWAEVGSTRDTWFEDPSVDVGVYEYRIVDSDSGRTLAQSQPISIPEPPAPAAPSVAVAPGGGRVRLSWSGDEIETRGYNVYRSESPDGPWTRLPAVFQRERQTGRVTCSQEAEPGKTYYYRVGAVSLIGIEGPLSEPIEAAAAQPMLEPIVHLKFDGTDAFKVAGTSMVDGIPALRVGADSWVEMPPPDALKVADALTVQFWVKMANPGVMPVLVCHGVWDTDGFFVQRLGGRVRFFIAGAGMLDAGVIPLRRWTHVAAVYDGSRLTMYIDGLRAGSNDASGPGMIPSNRPLRIGRYELPGTEYQPEGWLADVRVYAHARSEREIKADFDAGQAQLKGTE